MPIGVAQTHEISGLIEREEIHARIKAGEHLAAILPHTQAANGVTVEADLGHLASGLFAQRFVSTALHDAELALAACCVGMVEEGGPTSFRPSAGAFDRTAHNAEVGDRRRADVEHHLDVGTDLGLDIDGAFRGEEVGRAVVGRFERGAVVGQFGAEEKIW